MITFAQFQFIKNKFINVNEFQLIKTKISEMEDKEFFHKELIKEFNKIINDTKKKKQTNKEKKPLSPYNLFVKEKMAVLKDKFPDSKERMKKCAELWKQSKVQQIQQVQQSDETDKTNSNNETDKQVVTKKNKKNKNKKKK
jgi:hypothetical protein